MKGIKKWLCGGLSAVLAVSALCFPLAGSAVFAAETVAPVRIELNGEPLHFSGAPNPVNVNGSVLVPMRIIFESLGATVEWNEDDLMVTGTLGNQKVRTSIGSLSAYVNDELIDLATPSQMIDGTTMVPVRFVAEGLHAVVGWNETTNTVSIQMDLSDMGGPEDEDDGQEEDVIPEDEQKSSDKDYSKAYFPIEEGGYYYLQSVLPSGGCLLTCLAMVASNIHQDIVSPEEVYGHNGKAVKVGSWTNIEEKLELKRAETIDFLKIPVEERLGVVASLVEAYPEGVIIGFNKQGSWHYVVVMDYDEETKTILVNDPVGGHKVPLIETWTGNRKFTSQSEAITYLQNGKAYLKKDGEKRTVNYQKIDMTDVKTEPEQTEQTKEPEQTTKPEIPPGL